MEALEDRRVMDAGTTGGGLPFSNLQPLLATHYIIALQGIYPNRDPAPLAPDSNSYIGEIRPFAGTFAPGGWTFADGQLLSIRNNTALFSLLGTQYGGDGLSTFALPNLLDRFATSAGQSTGLSNVNVGQAFGANIVTLNESQLPAHTHTAVVGTTNSTGGNQPFNNEQPTLGLNYIINGGGELRLFAGSFAPTSWAFANGQHLSISQNTALFNLIHTTYGGDGINTFALPDLRDRVAVSLGQATGMTLHNLGDAYGSETVALTEDQLPPHTHTLPYGGTTGIEGGGQPFDNDQPTLAVNYAIALQGIYPSRDSSGAFGTATPVLAEIRAFATPDLPQGWAPTDGRLLPIAQNQALFSLIGTIYGGDGRTTFALPDLRGRAIVETSETPGQSVYNTGERVGQQLHTLSINEMPAHGHTLPNLQPFITGPNSATVPINKQLVFSTVNGNSITLGDMDAGNKQVQLTITVNQGTLAFASTSGLLFSGGTFPQSAFTVRGTLNNLNAALKGLTFTPATEGLCSMQLTVDDLGNTGTGGPQIASLVIPITVDRVQYIVDNVDVGYSETGTWTTSNLKGFNHSSVRQSTDSTATAKWVAPISPGYYDVSFFNVVKIGSATNAKVSVVHNGVTDDVFVDQTTADSGFVFLGNFFFSSDPSESILLSRTGTKVLRADAVIFNKTADAPTIAAPTAQSTVGALTFSVNRGNRILLGDADAAGTDVQLSLAVSHGIITLPSIAGISFTSGANGSAAFTVRGPLEQLNAALNGLVFVPTSGYKGPDSLQISVNDLGNTGSGGALSASSVIALSIGYPVVVIDFGDTGYSESGTWFDSNLTGFNHSLTRRSSTSSTVTAKWEPILSAGKYAVSFYKVVRSDGAANSQVMITHGGVSEIQNIDLTTGSTGFVDLGNFAFNGTAGEGIQLSRIGTSYLRADAVRFTKSAEPPVVIAPSGLQVTQDVRLALSPTTNNAIALSDPDSASSKSQLALAVSHGTLKFASSAGLTFLSGANNQASFTVSGTISALDNALVGLSYLPSLGYNGADNLLVTVTDKDSLTASAMIGITVNPVAVIAFGAPGYSETGAWTTTGNNGFNKSSVRYSTALDAAATWAPTLVAGFYRVEFYKVVNSSLTASATLTITHNGKSQQQLISLGSSSSGFVDVGTFYFDGVSSESLSLTRNTANGALRANAVRFTKVLGP